MSAVIDLQGVGFAYASLPTLSAIDLKVADGEFLGIVGPNAGGKSTQTVAIVRSDGAPRPAIHASAAADKSKSGGQASPMPSGKWQNGSTFGMAKPFSSASLMRRR